MLNSFIINYHLADASNNVAGVTTTNNGVTTTNNVFPLVVFLFLHIITTKHNSHKKTIKQYCSITSTDITQYL